MRRGLVAALLSTGAWLAVPAASAAADLPCIDCPAPGVQTPLGFATVTVTPWNAVTVNLAPIAANTFVVGVPFSMPPGPPTLPGYTRTTFDSTGGLVVIDTIQLPPGPPTRPARPSLAVISIHPPSPCRVATTGFTVVFTPVIPPRAPG